MVEILNTWKVFVEARKLILCTHGFSTIVYSKVVRSLLGSSTVVTIVIKGTSKESVG